MTIERLHRYEQEPLTVVLSKNSKTALSATQARSIEGAHLSFSEGRGWGRRAKGFGRRATGLIFLGTLVLPSGN